jgi:G:T/U-mismatch repair DNA glycosylase
MIMGSFPIGKFSNPKRRHEIKPHEIDFLFGGEGNQLWKLLGKSFDVTLDTKEKIIAFLEKERISIGDVIVSCRRKKGSGNDSDLYDIEWNPDLHDIIKKNKFKRIYFTSKSVYHWYVKHIGRVEGPEEIFLLSPSANGVRSIPRLKEYQEWEKTVDMEKKTSVFRELFYKKIFRKYRERK